MQRLHARATKKNVVWGLYRDNGKENGNYRDYKGLYRDYIVIIGPSLP